MELAACDRRKAAKLSIHAAPAISTPWTSPTDEFPLAFAGTPHKRAPPPAGAHSSAPQKSSTPPSDRRGSRNVSLDTISPKPYSFEYRMARKAFER
jgi:hypothetical protein